MTNNMPVYILPLVNINMYWPVIGHLYCMASPNSKYLSIIIISIKKTGNNGAQYGYGPNSGFGAVQTGYGVPQTGYGAPQTGYGVPSYSGTFDSYGAPSSSYNSQNNGYGTSNGYYASTDYAAPGWILVL